MKKIWHHENPLLLKQLQEQLKNSYPSLHVFVVSDQVFVRGNFPIYDQDKKRLLDEFKIEIEIPNNFPEEIPIVREIGGEIPKIADRHFYPTGQACLFMPEERHKYLSQNTTIMDFIEGPIKNFFIGQISYATTGKWIFGAREHGTAGVIDFYKDIIGTTDEATVTKFMIYLSKKKVKGHWACYCSSGKKMRACHFEKLLEVREFIKPNDVALSLHTALIELPMLSYLKSKSLPKFLYTKK